MSEVLFFIAGLGAIAGALGVVSLRNAFYSVLALVCHLLSLAALFLLLQAQFVAAAQVIVYAGAVMVLYVFVVSYVGQGGVAMQHDRPRPPRRLRLRRRARSRADDRDARLRAARDRQRGRGARRRLWQPASRSARCC